MSSFDSQTLGRRINELLILQELQRSPLHGYQILLQIEEGSGGYFQFSHGTLYPILHRLEKDGFVAGQWSDPAEGRARKEYVLTQAGRTHLQGLREDWQEVRDMTDAFLARGKGPHGEIRTGTA